LGHHDIAQVPTGRADGPLDGTLGSDALLKLHLAQTHSCAAAPITAREGGGKGFDRASRHLGIGHVTVQCPPLPSFTHRQAAS